jgi:hypothetical protein
VPVTVVRFEADGWVRQIDRRGLLGLVDPGGILRLEIDAGRYAIRSTPLCTIWPVVAEARVERSLVPPGVSCVWVRHER